MSATAASPDARALWRSGRGPLLGLLVLVLAAALLAFLRTGDEGLLHPRSATPNGAMAIAELLKDEGIAITEATTYADASGAVAPGTTMLVTRPDAIAPARLAELHQAVNDSGGRLVLLAPGPASVAALDADIEVAGAEEAAERQPECPAEEPGRAGSATLGGYLYDPADAAGCYPVHGFPTLVTVSDGPGETVLVGSPALFANERLADLGNASLALQLLGAHEELAWYLPSPGEAPPPQDEQSPFDLAGDGWRWAAAQLAIAAALTALWRMRRLGPVVAERLPVRIRAAETTEGHARLYHQAGARDRAAEALRAATRGRLALLTGLPRTHSEAALSGAVADRSGRTPAEVHGLLFGPGPADDRELVRLADQLDALERRLGPAAPGTPAGHTPGDGGTPAPGEPRTHRPDHPSAKDSSP